MIDFIKSEKERRKIKKGSASRNRTDPKRKAEAKHQIKDRIKELETQEARLLLDFMATRPPDELTLNRLELLWTFIHWLKKIGYHIIDGQAVFCFPFDRLVKFKDLK